MDNNNIVRRIRDTFHLGDAQIVVMLGETAGTVSLGEVAALLKREDDEDRVKMTDDQLGAFLDGFIVHRRGKSDRPAPVHVGHLNNNVILRKLKIALNLKNEDILRMMKRAGKPIGKPELSAFFRRPDHRHFRECQDQFLRNFLKGMFLEYRRGSSA